METHDFARMLTVPIRREGGTSRGTGTIVGFGELIEGLDTPDNGDVVDGRLTRFLKPLAVAS
jgi:hypothetical protein